MLDDIGNLREALRRRVLQVSNYATALVQPEHESIAREIRLQNLR
jgi:hypothetical protein